MGIQVTSCSGLLASIWNRAAFWGLVLPRAHRDSPAMNRFSAAYARSASARFAFPRARTQRGPHGEREKERIKRTRESTNFSCFCLTTIDFETHVPSRVTNCHRKVKFTGADVIYTVSCHGHQWKSVEFHDRSLSTCFPLAVLCITYGGFPSWSSSLRRFLTCFTWEFLEKLYLLRTELWLEKIKKLRNWNLENLWDLEIVDEGLNNVLS